MTSSQKERSHSQQDCLVEIKSRDHKNESADDIMAQMWLYGCHNLYLARHVRGCFDHIGAQLANFQQDLISWQHVHKANIAAFRSILHTVRTIVQTDQASQSTDRYAVVLQEVNGINILELRRRDAGQDMLSDHIVHDIWLKPVRVYRFAR